VFLRTKSVSDETTQNDRGMTSGTNRSRYAYLLYPTPLMATVLVAMALTKTAHSQPPIDFQWNNFVSTGTAWSSAANWVPAGPPTSSIDRVLGFGSSTLQTVTGYTATNTSGQFNVNSLVFNPLSNVTGGVTVTSSLATDSVNFATSSTSLLPSIWQLGTARVAVNHTVAGATGIGITLAGGATGTTLQILGNGLGDVYLNSNIGQTGAGASGIKINQTGTRPLNTGSIVRLSGATSNYTGGVNLTAGNWHHEQHGDFCWHCFCCFDTD
jgi:hypothetical protein